MITKSLQRIAGASLSLGLIAALTATPVAAMPGDLFPLSPSATLLTAPDAGFDTARRGRGADDAPGDDHGRGKRRGRGSDDGQNHTWMNDAGDDLLIARRGRGADDAPGDDHGRGKGRGRGFDDAPNHG